MDSHRLHAAILLAGSALLLGTSLGSIGFWAPDEPRYGQVAEEIRSMEHGATGIVLLHLGGDPYTQKPPLYYWLAALLGATGERVTEVAARLPSVFAGIATVMLTYALGLRLFGSPLAALFAGALLLTSFRFAHLARRAQLDVLLALFETAALAIFWRIDVVTRPCGGREGEAAAPRSLVFGLHAALGAAALTKGPVGWIPLLVIAGTLAWEKRLPVLRQLLPAWGLALSVAPVLMWVLGATWLAPSGFFSEAVVDNLVGRVVDAVSHVRPFYYYAYQLPLDYLPWTLTWPFLIYGATRARRAGGDEWRAWRFLIVWTVVPLVLFSLASGKRGLYLLPAFPALALGCAAAVNHWLGTRNGLPAWLRIGFAVLGLAGAYGSIETLGRESFEWSRYPGFSLTSSAAAALLATAAAGLLATALCRSGRAAFATAIVTVLLLEFVIFTVVYPQFDAEKSPRGIATLVASLSDTDERIGIFDDAGLAGGILYYGHRKVAILPRPEQVQDFLDRGGRFVVLERWKLPWLEPVGELHVHGTARRDRRELAIVSPLPPH